MLCRGAASRILPRIPLFERDEVYQTVLIHTLPAMGILSRASPLAKAGKREAIPFEFFTFGMVGQ